jgi:flagellar FliJ protein
MKALKTLIRLQRRTLNELRKVLGDLERQRGQLIQASLKLSDELQQEIEFASGLPEMGNFFGNFSKRIQKRQQDIAVEVRKVDVKAEEVRKQIAEAFSETKKYEIALENWEREQLVEANRKETILLDDIGIQQYGRVFEEGASST